MFKKKWLGCWATRWPRFRAPRFQTRRSNHDGPGSTSSSGRNEASLPGAGGSARDLVSAPAAPCFSSYRPAFGSAFVAGAVGKRTVRGAGVSHEERFQDCSPAQVYAALLDEGRFHCSIRTMYRLLEARGESRERRDQLTHPPYLRLSPWLRQTVKTLFAVRCKFIVVHPGT